MRRSFESPDRILRLDCVEFDEILWRLRGNLVIYRCKVGARLGQGWGKTLGKVGARLGQGRGRQDLGKVGERLG